jgi:very-short-patch-repair endonuclease
MRSDIEDDLYMVDDHFSRSGKMVRDNHFVGTHEMVGRLNGADRISADLLKSQSVIPSARAGYPDRNMVEFDQFDAAESIPATTWHPLPCTGEGTREDVLLERAKRMRSNQTEADAHLWQRIRAHRLAGLKFKRQKPIGRFIVDFVCHESALVVEVDGGYHVEQVEYDEARTAWLKCQGFQVLRFWNHEVLGQIESVLERIQEAASAPSPAATRHTLPHAGEGMGEGAKRQADNGGGG